MLAMANTKDGIFDGVAPSEVVAKVQERVTYEENLTLSVFLTFLH